MYIDFPANVRTAEFARLRFHLEFQESCALGKDSILRLRRELHASGRQVLGPGERFDLLFDPPLPSDPEAVRRHQRPGPPFALYLPSGLPRIIAPGDELVLPALFLGSGVLRVNDFLRVLREQGRQGIHQGEGRFEVALVESADATGLFRMLWREGENPGSMAPSLIELGWWLETALPTGPLILEFLTPARVLSRGRPLFQASFSRLFPFFLRRVTSMLYAHCGIEAVVNPGPLLEQAARVVELRNVLAWEDWRILEGNNRRLELGGVAGRLELMGDALDSLRWILGIGSLLNLGRSAAYAGGHFLLLKGR